jgi:hypothetical protein
VRSAYRVLAYLVALEVVVQAAAIAFATFGLLTFVSGGGVLDRSTQQAHAYALALLVVAFFAKIPGGIVWAAVVFVTTVVQVALGQLAHAVPTFGWVHGALAIGLFAVAVVAARRADAVAPTVAEMI